MQLGHTSTYKNKLQLCFISELINYLETYYTTRISLTLTYFLAISLVYSCVQVTGFENTINGDIHQNQMTKNIYILATKHRQFSNEHLYHIRIYIKKLYLALTTRILVKFKTIVLNLLIQSL